MRPEQWKRHNEDVLECNWSRRPIFCNMPASAHTSSKLTEETLAAAMNEIDKFRERGCQGGLLKIPTLDEIAAGVYGLGFASDTIRFPASSVIGMGIPMTYEQWLALEDVEA